MSRHYVIRGLLQRYSAFVPGYGDSGGCKNYSTKFSGPKIRKFTNPNLRKSSSRVPRKVSNGAKPEVDKNNRVPRKVSKEAKTRADKNNRVPRKVSNGAKLEVDKNNRVPRKVSKEAKTRADKNNRVPYRNTIMQISNILRSSSWESAQEQLQMFCVKWDSYTVNQVLKSRPPMEMAWLFFNWIPKDKGYKHDQYTYTTMLDIFGEAGRINSMLDVLQTMHAMDITITVVTYTSVLHWLAKSGDFDGAKKVWEEMHAVECYPTVVSYTAYMKVLFDNNRAAEATKIYKEMIQAGLSPTGHTYTILMLHLISSGKCKTALEIFEKLQETTVIPDKTMCNILVEHFCRAAEVSAVIHILHYMKKNMIVLRKTFYLMVHETLKIAGVDDTLLRQVNPHTALEVFDESVTLDSKKTLHDLNVVIDDGLLNAFLRKKNFAASDRLFAGMVSRNVLLNSELVSEIIEVNCNHARTNAALIAFEYSKNMGIQIEQVAYLSLIGILFRTNELSKMLQIIEEMVNFRSYLEPAFAASLIYRLGQIKELDLAISIFNLLPEEIKSTTAYTALIDACFSAGFPEKGIQTFGAMKTKGIQCASGTYNVLIKSLEICGRRADAVICRKAKKTMEREYHDRNPIMLEQKICDALFKGYIVTLN